jgi:hypothetical protein
MVHLAYRGESDAILKWLAQFRVDRVATPQTSLEEAFIQYYRQSPDSTAGGNDGMVAKGGRS